MPIGCKVTLRGRRMYEFMDRLISLALPRVRDFRGISRKAFDGNGSYSLGLAEQLVFPELNPDKFTRAQGMNITFVVTNATDEAVKTYRTVLAADAGAAGAHYGLAFLLLRDGRRDEAGEHLRAFLASPPDGPEAQRHVDHARQTLETLSESTSGQEK